jgi:hypothetical protein
MSLWYSDPGGENIVPLPTTIQIKKQNYRTDRFCIVNPHSEQEALVNVPAPM